MQVEGHVQAITEDLARIGALGDEATARAAELFAAALESSLRHHLQEALAEAALELSAQLEPARVEVLLAGGELHLHYRSHDGPVFADAADEALGARITLRLPESLKARLEAAAAAGGVSVNAWLVQVLTRMLTPRPSPGGRHRLTGYGRS